MGSTVAAGYAEMVNEGMIGLETALVVHLQSNHYPPVSVAWVPFCIKAITLANEGSWDTAVGGPQGCKQNLTVAEMVEGLHLDWFLDMNDLGD